ncbi:histidine--tRNA ligase [Vagococcus intermedius]|uniref:Histidine--tRNA ligase n=1 Tax=Vagococcus intermedius TaxID=2991418 RepID=A0AAF0CUE2_9ENTE|nr:histidine--tRNA ligase [Vagococcus intermedius]WEG73210.1 histidine--tRNA ligase [Vagococcus intermedius]WEG75295.1 histidine--tRNA ligase [Vagococcus intermedius]
MAYQKPKGTADILPGKVEKWQFIEATARSLFKTYEFHEIRTPIFEHYEVISRSVGDTTDIVSKEMYDFKDKGDRHVTLRPEGTAPIVRSFVENKLFGPEHQKPYKVYYMGPMFRYERPQAGRFRQFHQIGAEVFGSNNPATDVEAMMMAMAFYRQLGVKHIRLVVNSLGSKEDRLTYRQALIDYLEPRTAELSHDSQKRLHDNPLRVLDSKDQKDQEIVAQAPSILDYLSEESASFFNEVKTLLEALEVPYEIDHRMVRGLDYYNHTIFEIMSDAPGFGGAITTICAGGRYDGLVEELGGPETAGFGFALGVERALITLDAEGIEVPATPTVDVYVVGLGEETNLETLKLVQSIRQTGLVAERDFMSRKVKAQFKTANKLQAKLVLTLGETELAEGNVKVKNMITGQEETLSLQTIHTDFKKVFETLTSESTN